MRTLTLLSFFSLVTLAACGSRDTPVADAPPVPPITEAIIGTWETIEVEVNYPTYEGRDTSVHHLIKEADWGRSFGVRPARTVFTPDGKLARTHRLQNGQVADVTHGLWQVSGPDTLLFIEPNKTLFYAYTLDGDRLTLKGSVDYDYDGEADDDYRAELRLVGRTE